VFLRRFSGAGNLLSAAIFCFFIGEKKAKGFPLPSGLGVWLAKQLLITILKKNQTS
jgi:hypothetical protein